MSVNQLLVSSFRELAGEIPSPIVGEFVEHHLNRELRSIFEETSLPKFCKFLLDNLKKPGPLVGLAIALKNLNDDLSLHAGQFLPVTEIEEILLQFNILCKSESGELLTAEGGSRALIHFGKSTFILYDTEIITGFEDQRFSNCQSVSMTPEGLFSGVFQFNDSLLPVVASNIINTIDSKPIDCFFGKVLENECFGCIKSGEDFYLVDRGQVKQKLNFVVDRCDICLDPEGMLQAIIFGLDPVTFEPIHYSVINGKLQKTLGASQPKDVKTLWADPKSSDIYSIVVNPDKIGKRIAEFLDEDGFQHSAEFDYLLPMVNGVLIDQIAFNPIDYILGIGFFDGEVYGKVVTNNHVCFAFGDHLRSQIDQSKITEVNFGENFLYTGNAIITLEDGRCFQLAQGKIVKTIESNKVIDYRPISISNEDVITGPTGFFKFKLGWMLVINGEIDREFAKVGCLQLDSWEYQATLSPNLKLSFSATAICQQNVHSAPNFIDLLVIDGQNLKTIAEDGAVPRRPLSYTKLNFLPSGDAVCQIMLDDGSCVYYENESCYSPKEFFLLGNLCFPKEQFNEFLAQFEHFQDLSLLEITDLNDFRIAYNGQCYCSLQINGIPHLLLGSALFSANDFIRSLELNVSTPGSMHLKFTRNGTIESYGYEHF